VIGALIDASGATGGGLVRIGGTFQGGNGDPNDPLYTSYIGRFGALPAIASAPDRHHRRRHDDQRLGQDRGRCRNRRRVVGTVYSFTGTIAGTAVWLRGMAAFAEVSSHGVLDYRGTTNLLASAGRIGTLLLDPWAVTIVAGSGGTISGGQFNRPAIPVWAPTL